MDLKRSLVTIALAAAVSATAIAGPADASPASGGSYAASVATKPGPTVTLHATTVTLGSRILSTSDTVSQLHGTIQLKAVRSNGGAQVYSTTKTVSGKSGTGYWVTIPRSKFKKGIWYRLYAVYTATSGHIEKSSTAYKSFKP